MSAASMSEFNNIEKTRERYNAMNISEFTYDTVLPQMDDIPWKLVWVALCPV